MGAFTTIYVKDCECGATVCCRPNEVLMIWTDWNAATVTATCKNCGRVVEHKTVKAETRQRLSWAGVTETYPPSPGEEYPGGPPISHDDVLEFHNKVRGRA